MIRKKIYDIIEASQGNDLWSSIYDYVTMVLIITSLTPLAFKESNRVFVIIDLVCAILFAIDYLLRWATADYKYGSHSVLSFLRYPFGFMALVDLISILPSVTVLNSSFKLLRIFRLMRAFRVFRVFKAFRYSKSMRIIVDVLKNSKRSLASVGMFAIGYILVAALVIFNVEPESFETFFDAVYWATVSLTTVGYGDIHPVSIAGKVVAMLSSLCGIAIIALPSGIVTAGYMKAIGEPTEERPPRLWRRGAKKAQALTPPEKPLPSEERKEPALPAKTPPIEKPLPSEERKEPVSPAKTPSPPQSAQRSDASAPPSASKRSE